MSMHSVHTHKHRHIHTHHHPPIYITCIKTLKNNSFLIELYPTEETYPFLLCPKFGASHSWYELLRN